MIYHHCAPSDFDEWTEDAPGWSYAALRPYFRKAEKYGGHDLHPDVDVSHRGADGVHHTGHAPRLVRFFSYLFETYSEISQEICEDCLQSCRNVGIPYSRFVPPSYFSGYDAQRVFSDFNTPKGTLGCNHLTSFLDSKGHRKSSLFSS